jgi:cysteine desulfurase
MAANNETGVISDLDGIAQALADSPALWLVDGVQALGKLSLRLCERPIDYAPFSGHKLYAPKGIGALYVKSGTRLAPIQFGGKHERERRPGTENVPGAVALGGAAAQSAADLAAESRRLTTLRDRLENGILACVRSTGVNGAASQRTPNTSNIYFDGLEGEALVISLDLKGFAVSSGSACSSGAVEPSHVLIAMGLPRERARASLRFSLGQSNNEEQVDALIEAIAESVAQLRKLSPTYTASV